MHDKRNQLHTIDLEMQGLHVSIDSMRSTIERLSIQSKRIEEHEAALELSISQDDEPELDYQKKLEDLFRDRNEAEEQLKEVRASFSDMEDVMQASRIQLSESEQQIATTRDKLEQQRIQAKEYSVRFETLIDQIRAGGFLVDDVLDNLDQTANESEWQTKVSRLEEKISGIGPVNLVAIEEFEEQTERKEYLDSQCEDLSNAIVTLEEVIKKIDRETRELFKETFESLNHGFREFFPQLFGGGTAVLELTDNDLLKAGVTVMARPPGKRNSTIHLLSGGEKALTAVALLFALFRLNPAPFCILDEVDAPLDDSNVERYCSTIHSLAKWTQLIVITHNKITMEAADILLGVTMGEPGVSSIVSVDVEQAVGMAAG